MSEKRTVFIKPWEFKLPTLPNFILDAHSDWTIDVAYLDDEALRMIGEAWSTALLEHAERRRAWLKNR
jgi:hypothetical protein